MCKLYANPYNTSVIGFYFSSYEEYESKSSKLTDGFGYPVEEFEILDESEQVEIYYRCEYLGQDTQEAIDKLNGEGTIYNCSVNDYALDYVNDCGIIDCIPEHIQRYFDYEAFARDLELNGEVCEFSYDHSTYTASGF